jgi:hypothetical protein
MWLNITMQEYHALDAIGSSALRVFALQGQTAYYARYIAKIVEQSDTDAKRLGRAFHLAMENPDGWRNKYVIAPTIVEDETLVTAINATLSERTSAKLLRVGDPIDMRLQTHRLYVQHFAELAEQSGKEVLTDKEAETVERQIAAVYDNPACREYVGLKGQCNVEVACVSEDEATGLKIKALCDLVVGDTIVDFKTTKALSPLEFVRDAERFGYDFQAAHYLHVTGKDEFRFISVTTEPPFVASVFYVPGTIIARRKEQNLQSLQQIEQLLAMSEFSEQRDSQGIPIDWMPEGWGGEYPLDSDAIRRGLDV